MQIRTEPFRMADAGPTITIGMENFERKKELAKILHKAHFRKVSSKLFLDFEMTKKYKREKC